MVEMAQLTQAAAAVAFMVEAVVVVLQLAQWGTEEVAVVVTLILHTLLVLLTHREIQLQLLIIL